MVYLPIFDDAHSSTRDKIISVLASNPNLSTKQISNFLKKNYALNVTYQAVHKTLKQMVSDEVLIFDNKGYTLNQAWAMKLKQFAESALRKGDISDKKTAKIQIISEKLEIINASNLSEAEEFFFKFREEYFNNIEKYPEKDRVLCMHAPHLYIALMSATKEYEFMDRLLKNKTRHYALCKGNTIVDKWIQRFYNSREGNPYLVKTGANCSSINEVWLYPDKLIEVFFSEKFWNFYDSLYRSIKNIEEINYATIIQKLYLLRNEPFKIVIHKDSTLIKLAKEETLRQFGITDEFQPFELKTNTLKKEVSNKKRFEEMEETYSAYFPVYKKMVLKLDSLSKSKSILLKKYVIDKLGSKVGIRAYILRKFLELNNLNWKDHLNLLGFVELHLASMYCFNAGADNKTCFKVDKKSFFSCKKKIKEYLFNEVRQEYGPEIEQIFRDTDFKCYIGLTFDTIFNTKSNFGKDRKTISDFLAKKYDYNVHGIEKEIVDNAFKKYQEINDKNALVLERTYGLNAVMIENLAKIASLLSNNHSIEKNLMGFGAYCGLSNMIINDIQDFSLDLVDTEIPTREKEKKDVFADLKNGYITWVINYALESGDKEILQLTKRLLNKKNADYTEYEKIRKLFVEKGLFKIALCDAIGYAFLGIRELEQISTKENIENINLLKDLIMTTARGSKYITLMEKKYLQRIRLTTSEYKKIRALAFDKNKKGLLEEMIKGRILFKEILSSF